MITKRSWRNRYLQIISEVPNGLLWGVFRQILLLVNK